MEVGRSEAEKDVQLHEVPDALNWKRQTINLKKNPHPFLDAGNNLKPLYPLQVTDYSPVTIKLRSFSDTPLAAFSASTLQMPRHPPTLVSITVTKPIFSQHVYLSSLYTP